MNKVDIFGTIGIDITAEGVKDQLEGIEPNSEIEVNLHTSGGDVFEGYAIASLLSQFKTKGIVHGLAASMGSYIALRLDSLEMNEGSMLMIHNPFSGGCGDAESLRKEADRLDQVKADMVKTYQAKLGDDACEMMDATTWISASEAVELGLATLREKQFVTAAFSGNLNCSKYDNLFAKSNKKLSADLLQITTKLGEAEAKASAAELAAEDLKKQNKELQAEMLEFETKVAQEVAKASSLPASTEDTSDEIDTQTNANAWQRYKAISSHQERRVYFIKNRQEILASQPKNEPHK